MITNDAAHGIPIKEFQNSLLVWFYDHKRNLPWRTEPRNPYYVWLAETMLQQTQVISVIPYYERWLLRFPTLASLARASIDDVLKQWEGLGYYSRAQRLHTAARQLVNELDGVIPRNVDQLMALPGIGRYTAGAIASLAYSIDAPVLDGNVARILSRLIALTDMVQSKTAVDTLWNLTSDLLPSGRAGEFNEALMDLGALVCTPRKPNCGQCPVAEYCTGYRCSDPTVFPVRKPKNSIPHKDIASIALIDPEGRLLLAQRPPHGLLGGLWEFPGGELNANDKPLPVDGYEHAAIQLAKTIHETTGILCNISTPDFQYQVKHAFTHFRITRHIALIRMIESLPLAQNSVFYSRLKWFTHSEISNIALTRSDAKILKLVQEDLQANRIGHHVT